MSDHLDRDQAGTPSRSVPAQRAARLLTSSTGHGTVVGLINIAGTTAATYAEDPYGTGLTATATATATATGDAVGANPCATLPAAPNAAPA